MEIELGCCVALVVIVAALDVIVAALAVTGKRTARQSENQTGQKDDA